MTVGLTVTLNECCEIVAGGRRGFTGSDFVPDGYPAYGAGGLNGHLASYEFDRPAVILSSIGARCGKCFLAEGQWASLANTQLILPDTSRVDVRFLWYQLNDELSWHRSGTAQPFIKPSDVKSRRIVLPPIGEQRQIASMLDQANELRGKRRASLADMDSLTESIFLNLFGDPRTNPFGYKVGCLRDVAEQITDGEHKTPVKSARGVKLLSARNVREGYLDFSKVDFVSPSVHAVLRRRCDPSPGDILISCSGTIGRVARIRVAEPLALVRSVAFVRASRNAARPHFLEQLLRTAYLRRWMVERANASSQANLFQNQVASIPVIIPPMQRQEVFEERVNAVDGLRTLAESTLPPLQELILSLQHRAFARQL